MPHGTLSEKGNQCDSLRESTVCNETEPHRRIYDHTKEVLWKRPSVLKKHK